MFFNHCVLSTCKITESSWFTQTEAIRVLSTFHGAPMRQHDREFGRPLDKRKCVLAVHQHPIIVGRMRAHPQLKRAASVNHARRFTNRIDNGAHVE
jgi:hypothetical protein